MKEILSGGVTVYHKHAITGLTFYYLMYQTYFCVHLFIDAIFVMFVECQYYFFTNSALSTLNAMPSFAANKSNCMVNRIVISSGHLLASIMPVPRQ